MEKAGENGSVRFVVKDSGPGIDPEILSRLFAPFTQGDSSMSRKHGGTGLGLSISKLLVELMNGTIDSRSVPGRGSAFSFTVPLQPVEVARPPTTVAPRE